MSETLQEFIQRAKGELIIAIGEGKFSEAVYRIIYTAHSRGYEVAEKIQKEQEKQKRPK